MEKNVIIPYDPHLKEYAKALRKNSTLAEVILWQQIKKRRLGVQFHHQVPIHQYIADFYCHELLLAIELFGNSHSHPINKEEDAVRDFILKKLGVKVIRISERDVKMNRDSVFSFLQKQVNSRIRELENTH